MKMAYTSKSKNFPTLYPPHFPQLSLRALDHRISELKKRIKAGGSPGLPTLTEAEHIKHYIWDQAL